MLTTEQVGQIRPGYCVTLTGPGYPDEGMLLEVLVVRRLKEFDGDKVWYLADLAGGHVPLFLIVEVEGHTVRYYLTHTPADIERGTRRDQLDQGHHWLFAEPEDKSHFIPSTLAMSKSFAQTKDNAVFQLVGDTVCVELRQKPLFRNILDPQFARLTHYKSDKLTLNPHLFVIEVGGVDGDGEAEPDGGFIDAFQGTAVDDSRIEIDSV